MNTNINKEKAGKPIKVLVVDDSALVRKLLTDILQADPEIEVIGTAADPYAARDKIKKHNPDVLTLDIEMPRMDGITFLSNLMRLHPMPVIMVASLTEQSAEATLQALELGAVDFVAKPHDDLTHNLEEYEEEIVYKVKVAADTKVRALVGQSFQNSRREKKKLNADAIISKQTSPQHHVVTDSIIAIGASTGGTEAIKEVLKAMPGNAPGIVITQHIPAAFSTSFAERMDSVSAMTVCEARNGQQILSGHAYIAPGDKHLLIIREGAHYRCKLSDGPPVNRHKPAVDVLFRSAAQCAGVNAVGVLLTGMGDDGAKGLKEMQESGAMTIAQDEDTSVVWGMPGVAVKLGAADNVLPLGMVSGALISHMHAVTKYGT